MMPNRASTPARRQAGPATRPCREDQYLVEHLGHCERVAAEFAGDDRAVQLATDAAAHPPVLRLDTANGSRALSRRLISTYQLEQAAAAIDNAIAAAGRAAPPRPDHRRAGRRRRAAPRPGDRP